MKENKEIINQSKSYDEDFVPAQDLPLLLDVLPEKIRQMLEKYDLSSLIEIVLDFGRLPEARFFNDKKFDLGSELVTLGDINYAVNRVGILPLIIEPVLQEPYTE